MTKWKLAVVAARLITGAQGTIRARSYLILGGLTTVTAEAQWLDANLPPFGALDTPSADQTVSGYSNCDAVGYLGTIDAGPLTACNHLIEIEATDTDGNTRVIARRRINVSL